MFDALSDHPDTPLMQDRAFCAALQLCGETPVTLPSGLLVLSRRIVGVPLVMLPRVAPPDDLARQLFDVGLHRRPLILSPERPAAVDRAIRIAAPREILRVDLSGPKLTRRACLHQNWRHQLGQAEAGPLRVLHRPFSPDHPLLALEARQSQAKRYQNWPTHLTSAFATVAPDQTHVFTALLRGHPVAHMLFLTHGNRATYHMGHSAQEGRAHHAHNLLLWEAMNALAARGISQLELGPSTTQSIDRFKRRAGAQAEPTGGTWLRWTPLEKHNIRKGGGIFRKFR